MAFHDTPVRSSAEIKEVPFSTEEKAFPVVVVTVVDTKEGSTEIINA